MSNADAVIKFAVFAELPWLLFSDADPAGSNAAHGTAKQNKRPLQFCLFLSTLFGGKHMEQLMVGVA